MQSVEAEQQTQRGIHCPPLPWQEFAPHLSLPQISPPPRPVVINDGKEDMIRQLTLDKERLQAEVDRLEAEAARSSHDLHEPLAHARVPRAVGSARNVAQRLPRVDEDGWRC